MYVEFIVLPNAVFLFEKLLLEYQDHWEGFTTVSLTVPSGKTLSQFYLHPSFKTNSTILNAWRFCETFQ